MRMETQLMSTKRTNVLIFLAIYFRFNFKHNFFWSYFSSRHHFCVNLSFISVLAETHCITLIPAPRWHYLTALHCYHDSAYLGPHSYLMYAIPSPCSCDNLLPMYLKCDNLLLPVCSHLCSIAWPLSFCQPPASRGPVFSLLPWLVVSVDVGSECGGLSLAICPCSSPLVWC